MNEKEKYIQALKNLNNKYKNYTETDNRVSEQKAIWYENDDVMCINNNFIIMDPTHGPKEGLTFGKIYKIESVPEIDMINIKNDLDEVVPYYVWRFVKIIFKNQN